MKILTLSYLYYFSRYLDAIVKDIKSKVETPVETTHVCFYPSGYRYFKKNNIPAIPLFKKVKQTKKVDCIDFYKGFDLNQIIFFHKKLLGSNLNRICRLKNEAVFLIDFYEQLFENNDFDILLSFTENRMQVEIPIALAKRKGIKIWYMEQGPYKTMTIDSKGVLANVSFANAELTKDIDKEQLDNFIKNINTRNEKKYNVELTFLDKVINSKDNFYFSPPKILEGVFPLFLQDNTKFIDKMALFLKKKIRVKKIPVVSKKLPEKFIALILQVPADAQMIMHSPLYSNFVEMLKDVYEAIPEGYQLVVREHPVYRGMYEKELYEYIQNHSNILLINDCPLREFLKKAELIILNNSTVGLDALILHKKVLTLGNCYYNRKGVVFHLEEKNKMKETILYALKKEISHKEIDVFLYNLIFRFLIPNHLVSYKYTNIDIVTNKIIK